jgi:hypothetical protein
MGIRSKREGERRVKARFRIRRELRYKLLEDNTSGIGETIDMASGGVAIQIDHPLRAGTIIELAISWPVLLQDACPMRLIVFGRVVRNWGLKSACRVDRYEFRTQARTLHAGGRAPC